MKEMGNKVKKMKAPYVKEKCFPIFILVLMSILFPQSILASYDNISIEDITIIVMPEYTNHPHANNDEPTVLVGYHGTIVNQSPESISQGINLTLPVNKKNFFIGLAAHTLDETKESLQEIEVQMKKNSNKVTIIPEEPIDPGQSYKFVIEYYYHDISLTGNKKNFTYEYVADNNMDALNIIFFEPLGASDFSIQPTINQHSQDTMGINMYLYEVIQLKAGEKKVFDVSYEKKDNETTTSKIDDIAPNNNTSVQIQTNSSNNGGLSTNTIIAIVVISLIFLFTIMLLIFQKKKHKERESEIKATNRQQDKKKLRNMLANDEIDEQTYRKKMSELS
ncbi:hypothetical protein ACSVDA_12965 [Cytobacillus sp. Hm23]